MAPPLLTLQDIRLRIGSTPLLDGAELSVAPNDRICVVGRNGSGKSTLLKIAAGLIEPDAGERFIQPGATVRYLPQEPDFAGYSTVLDYVEAGLAPGDDHYRARYLLEHLGLSDTADPSRLSGGEARRAALARTLAPEPDILLLDEPTNHLDLPAIEWLEGELRQASSAIVMISHDRRFLENLSRATVWLDRGTVRRLEQGFDRFEAWRDQVFEEEEREQHKLARKIVMEEDWLRYGVTARRKRNQRRLAALHDMRARHRTHKGREGNVTLEAAAADRSGKLAIEALGLSKSFGDKPIVRDLSLRIARGDRIGIVGPNGAGKTTLIKLLTGEIEPDAGEVRHGTRLEMITLDQRRESLKPDWTVAEALTGGRGDQVVIGDTSRHVASYMKDFLFKPEQMRTPLKVLSGGERNRLMLARALAKASNLMVLDEPTNDLDLETLDVLEEMLSGYEGTLLLVSHDRDFLDRVVTSVLHYEGDGKWIEYAGGYADMLAQRREMATTPARPATKTKPSTEPQGSAPPARKRKLSFKETHALATLPAEMEKVRSNIASVEKRLADPQLYARDPESFARLTAELETSQAALTDMEERWLELEILREEIENA